MRVALAQINPTSADIHGNAAKIVEAIDAASAARADLVVTPELALPGYCIGDLVEDTAFLEANERALQGIAAGGARDHGGRRLHRLQGRRRPTITARSGSTTPPRSSATAASSSARASRSCRAIATSTTSATSRRASGASRSTPGPAVRCRGLACRSAKTCGTSIYDVKPVPELVVQGANLVLNLNASPFYPGKREHSPATDSPSHRSPPLPDRLRQHGRRRRQRQEHHPVRRREPGLRRRRAARRDRPPVRGRSGRRRSRSGGPARAAAPAADRSPCARSTTRW